MAEFPGSSARILVSGTASLAPPEQITLGLFLLFYQLIVTLLLQEHSSR